MKTSGTVTAYTVKWYDTFGEDIQNSKTFPPTQRDKAVTFYWQFAYDPKAKAEFITELRTVPRHP